MSSLREFLDPTFLRDSLNFLAKQKTEFTDLGGTEVGAGAWQTIINPTGRGAIEEFHVRSPNTDFKIEVTVNGVVKLSKTYSELRDIQQNSPRISAFAELDEDGVPTGYYVASIRNISYSVSLLLRVQNTGGTPTTFDQLFAKYRALGE